MHEDHCHRSCYRVAEERAVEVVERRRVVWAADYDDCERNSWLFWFYAYRSSGSSSL